MALNSNIKQLPKLFQLRVSVYPVFRIRRCMSKRLVTDRPALGHSLKECHPSIFPSRSWLVSAKGLRGLQLACNVGNDILLLDMEDSVPANQKATIRDIYVDALTKKMMKDMKVYVRLNEIESFKEVLEDLRAFTNPHVSGFVLPKLKTVSDLNIYNSLVSENEQKAGLTGHMKFVPILETIDAFFNICPIAGGCPRNVALIIGSADFSAELLCADNSVTTEALQSATVMAARKNKVEPIAGPYLKIDDHIGFEQFCINMKKNGFTGCATLTPDQTHIANIVFAFSQTEIKLAKGVVDMAKTKTQSNSISTTRQTVYHSREVIGPPHQRSARETLARHQLISKKFQNSLMSTPTVIPVLRNQHNIRDYLKIGNTLQSEEVTFSEGLKVFWDASFFDFSCKVGTRNNHGIDVKHLSVSFLVSMCMGLSVSHFSEPAIVHLGFYDAFQHRSVDYGDTFRSTVHIDEAFDTRGNNTIVYSSHRMINAKDEIIFSAKKRTKFDQLGNEAREKIHHMNARKKSSDMNGTELLGPELTPLRRSVFEIQLSSNSAKDYHHYSSLYEGQVLVHNLVKSFSESETTMLMRLMKLTNNHHYRRQCYESTNILVAGPFVVAAMINNFAKDFPNVLYEDITECTNMNKVLIGESITTLTHLLDTKTIQGKHSEFHELTLKHLAIKNVDPEVLSETEIPLRLLSDRDLTKPKEYEKICLESCPILYRKIACQAIRRVIIVKPS